MSLQSFREENPVISARLRGLDCDRVINALWSTGKFDTAEIASAATEMFGSRVTEAMVCRSIRRPGEMRA